MRLRYTALVLAFVAFDLRSQADPQRVILKKPATATLDAGGAVDVRLVVRVATGYHVQANPASEPHLVATAAYITSGRGIKAGTPSYPKGKPYKLAGAKDSVLTYDGDVEIKIPLRASQDIKPGKLELGGKLRYQACNDRVCFMPETIAFKVPVLVKAQ